MQVWAGTTQRVPHGNNSLGKEGGGGRALRQRLYDYEKWEIVQGGVGITQSVPNHLGRRVGVCGPLWQR